MLKKQKIFTYCIIIFVFNLMFFPLKSFGLVQASADMGNNFAGLGYGAKVLNLVVSSWQNPDPNAYGTSGIILRLTQDGRPYSCEIIVKSSSPLADNSICDTIAKIGLFPLPNPMQNTEIALTFIHSNRTISKFDSYIAPLLDQFNPSNYQSQNSLIFENPPTISVTGSIIDIKENQNKPIPLEELAKLDLELNNYSSNIFEQAKSAFTLPKLVTGTYQSTVKLDISPSGSLKKALIKSSSGNITIDEEILKTMKDKVIYLPTPTKEEQSLWLTFTIKH